MSAVVTPPPVGVRSLAPPPLPPHDLFDRLRRFSRDEYHKMMGAGVLYEGEPVELLEGLVVCKISKGTPHESCVRRLTVRLPRYLPDCWFVQIQNAIGLADGEPEPDGAILRGDVADFDGHHPEPDEIGVVVEVSDSSLIADRRDKGRQYSRAAIAVYWVMNLIDRQVEVYTDPDPSADPPRYQTTTIYTPGQDVPVVLEGVQVATIPAADLLP